MNVYAILHIFEDIIGDLASRVQCIGGPDSLIPGGPRYPNDGISRNDNVLVWLIRTIQVNSNGLGVLTSASWVYTFRWHGDGIAGDNGAVGTLDFNPDFLTIINDVVLDADTNLVGGGGPAR